MPQPGEATGVLAPPLDLDAATITDVFGPRDDPKTGEREFHPAIDFAAPRGTPLQAADGGTVVYAGPAGTLGNATIIRVGSDDAPNNVYLVYGHQDDIYVRVGDRVEQGEEIGTVGSTGYSTGPHLDFQVRLGSGGDGFGADGYLSGRPQDPLEVLGENYEHLLTIEEGDRGPAVQQLQASLEELGYDIGAAGADGIFGNDTERALEAFQRDQGLTEDGIVGPNVREAMAEALVEEGLDVPGTIRVGLDEVPTPEAGEEAGTGDGDAGTAPGPGSDGESGADPGSQPGSDAGSNPGPDSGSESGSESESGAGSDPGSEGSEPQREDETQEYRDVDGPYAGVTVSEILTEGPGPGVALNELSDAETNDTTRALFGDQAFTIISGVGDAVGGGRAGTAAFGANLIATGLHEGRLHFGRRNPDPQAGQNTSTFQIGGQYIETIQQSEEQYLNHQINALQVYSEISGRDLVQELTGETLEERTGYTLDQLRGGSDDDVDNNPEAVRSFQDNVLAELTPATQDVLAYVGHIDSKGREYFETLTDRQLQLSRPEVLAATIQQEVQVGESPIADSIREDLSGNLRVDLDVVEARMQEPELLRDQPALPTIDADSSTILYSPAVEVLQNEINEYRVANEQEEIQVDGVPGPETDQALRDLQEESGLRYVDGIAGPEAWGALADPYEDPTLEQTAPEQEAPEQEAPEQDASEPTPPGEDPTAEADDPSGEASDEAPGDAAATDDGEPVADGDEPVADGDEPVADGDEPVADDGEPVADGDEPVADGESAPDEASISDDDLVSDEAYAAAQTVAEENPEEMALAGRLEDAVVGTLAVEGVENAEAVWEQLRDEYAEDPDQARETLDTLDLDADVASRLDDVIDLYQNDDVISPEVREAYETIETYEEQQQEAPEQDVSDVSRDDVTAEERDRTAPEPVMEDDGSESLGGKTAELANLAAEGPDVESALQQAM